MACNAGRNIIEVPGKNWMSQGKEKTWPPANLTILVIPCTLSYSE